MLGDVVRETRIKKGLTQAKLARLAGVSRRHLAALEKGANVSVLVLKKVASVLDLTEIQLGGLELRSGDNAGNNGVNVAVVADAIREARNDVRRTEAMLARAEGLINGNSKVDVKSLIARFPRLPVRRVDLAGRRGADMLKEHSTWLEVKTAGELSQGAPIQEKQTEMVIVPASLIEKGEIVFRARGEKLRDHGIEDGDLLVVQLRQNGRAATGELVIGKIGNNVFIGRWWQKHGRKALMTDAMIEVPVGKSKAAMKIVAVINAVVRIEQ
jgi:transcriptional regulator with XRE-family HTH domain